VLKGAGQHRLLAYTNAGTALGNILLSLLWIREYGLVGQAMGTLVPVALAAIFVLWPAACRRVDMRVGAAFLQAVWPTVWPVVVMAAVVIPLRHALPVRLWAVAATAGIGSLAYFATFLALAVKSTDRRLYMEKVNELLRTRRRRLAAAAA
jgi:Na+-driven multidrug efflux pump